MEPAENSRPTIQRVVTDHGRQWLDLPGVVGVGIGAMDETPCVKVYFCDEQSLHVVTLPHDVAGYRIIKEVSGEIVAYE